MATRFGPDPGDASFFSHDQETADPPTPTASIWMQEEDCSWRLSSAIRVPFCNEEDEVVTPPSRPSHPAPAPTQLPLAQEQWTMVNNIQNMRIMLSNLEAHVLGHRVTVAHHLVLLRWQHAHLGPGSGHPDVPLWVEATNLRRGFARDNNVIIAASSRTRSRSRSRATREGSS